METFHLVKSGQTKALLKSRCGFLKFNCRVPTLFFFDLVVPVATTAFYLFFPSESSYTNNLSAWRSRAFLWTLKSMEPLDFMLYRRYYFLCFVNVTADPAFPLQVATYEGCTAHCHVLNRRPASWVVWKWYNLAPSHWPEADWLSRDSSRIESLYAGLALKSKKQNIIRQRDVNPRIAI